MLTELNWRPLEQLRADITLTALFKIPTGLIFVDTKDPTDDLCSG